MLAASLIARELQQTQPSTASHETLGKNPYLYQPVSKIENAACPACRSTGRSTDPFHRSTGRSTGCPTESWVLTVSRVGRPGGRPSSNTVHVVHIGRPGRSTDLLILWTVDRAGRPPPLFPAALLFSAAVSFAFPSSTSSAITSTTPRQSMSTSSAIFSLSNTNHRSSTSL